MHRFSALSLLTAAALACGLTATAVAAPSGAGWSATHTQALHLTGSLLGDAPAGRSLTISAVLPLRNADAANQLIAQRRILTSAQVRARFSPTGASVASVERYLREQGFTGLSVSANRLLVTGHATVAQAERAFATQISDYRLDGRTVYANTTDALVPAALSGRVAAVLGLSDVPMSLPKPALHRQASRSAQTSADPTTDDLTGFSPQAVENAYDAKSMAPADHTEIAVVAVGDMTPIIANLRFAEDKWGYSHVPVNVNYDGPKDGIVNNNPLSGNAEWDLDTQISTEMARNVKQLDVYDVGTFTDPEVARGINMFVSDNKATALSVSLGECDYIAFLDGAMLTTDEALAQGALQGQSAFASTGDNGYACPEVTSTGVPEGPPGASWPSDGEYTTGVGGTTLLADDQGNVDNEVAWLGGGGGISPWETAAPWTLQANGAGQAWEFFNQGGRAVPDISAVADSTTPVLIYADHQADTQPEGVGGTSVASPLTMGLWARVEAAHDNALGLAQYNFYALYNAVNPATQQDAAVTTVYVPASNPAPVPGFRDITLGTNGGCVASNGWDDCTGIGVLQAADLAKQIKVGSGPTAAAPGAGATPAPGAASSPGASSESAGTTSGQSAGAPKAPAAQERVVHAVSRSKGRKRLTRLRVEHVPAGATIRLTCAGAGCPKAFRLTLSRAAAVVDLLKAAPAYRRARLASGARLVITISRRGAKTRTVSFRA